MAQVAVPMKLPFSSGGFMVGIVWIMGIFFFVTSGNLT